ncbi:YqiJ family protein [Psychrobacter pygoscelis]|uniref:YqiJ family protein n=1 Tax=Psychrobacter pygoscelis TaxID=2488563 RepID=UPI00103DEFF7|nr:YqiJ family protein [Psychrobacter pygoscelis]
MWEIFDSSALAPFAIAGMVLIILLVVEIISFFFGGVSGFLDNLLPDSLVDADFDADMSLDADTDVSWGLKALDWLYVGRIPTMILLILFIASFCISGLVIQQLSLSILGHYLSPWLASLDALVLSFPFLKLAASLLYPILPKDESSAVSGDSLVGRQAHILIGYASVGSPAQAKLTDEYGQTHYVMVEPDPAHFSDTDAVHLDSNAIAPTTITSNDQLVITEKIGERYLVKKL